MSEVEAEPLRIVTVIGAGEGAMVLTSDHVVFQPPDAEAHAAAYVSQTKDLEEATDLLRELYLAVAVAMRDDPTHHVVADATAVIGLAVHAWLRLHGVALGSPTT